MEKQFQKIQLNKRTIVISDIHGHLTLFKKLLKKVHYNKEKDTLIILGDFIEKGPEILPLIDYLMELSQNKNVHILNGNCEWAILTWLEEYPYCKEYMSRARYSIYHEIMNKLGLNYLDYTKENLQVLLKQNLKKQIAFIESLPILIDSQDYVFVHAGIEDRVDYHESSLSSLLEQQLFLTRHHPLDRYVVVGHLPVSNYHTHHIDNHIIIDQNKKIISIDGGMGVKELGQLNALIIEKNEFKTDYVLPFSLIEVKKSYYPGLSHHHKVAWPDYEVQVLKKQEEFSLCKKIKNNERIMIKNEYLYTKDNKTYCYDDYESYQITVEKGDKVYYIKQCGEYVYIIKNKEIGWIKKECID